MWCEYRRLPRACDVGVTAQFALRAQAEKLPTEGKNFLCHKWGWDGVHLQGLGVARRHSVFAGNHSYVAESTRLPRLMAGRPRLRLRVCTGAAWRMRASARKSCHIQAVTYVTAQCAKLFNNPPHSDVGVGGVTPFFRSCQGKAPKCGRLRKAPYTGVGVALAAWRRCFAPVANMKKFHHKAAGDSVWLASVLWRRRCRMSLPA